MGKITSFRKNTFSFYFLLFLLGVGANGFSQCPTVANTTQSFCDSQSPTVADLVATNNGGGVVWYDTAVSTTPLLASTPLESGEDYFADDNTGTCGVRQSVTVSIVSRPIRLLAAIILCQESVVSDLNLYIIGNNVKWYTTATGGSPLNPTDPISNGAYYASQTNPITGCETTRNVINVQILIVPPPTGNTIQVFCAANLPTVSNLVANGTNILWYTSQTSGFPLDPSIPLINGQIYFAESNIFPCASTSRFQVTVTLNQPNNAGVSSLKSYCQSTISTQPSINLFNQLTGSPNSNGTWAGPIATSNGSLGTLNVSTLNSASSPYVFTYTVTNPPCPNASSTVTVNVIPQPTASVSVLPTTICANSPATITFTGTPNAIVTYNINGATNQTITLNATGTATINNTFSANTVINIVSVATTGTPSCVNTTPSSVTLTVLPLPTASVSVLPTTICANSPATITFTGTPNAIVTYNINGATNQTITLNATGTATINNTFSANTVINIVSVATTGTPSCVNTTPSSVTLTVLPLPTASVSVLPTTICANSPATITFTGTPNSIVTYNINGATNQTITLNATGTATINNTFSANTVINIVSVATTGTPSCVNTTPSSVTLTVLPLPTASVSVLPTTICANSPAAITFTGTPNAIVTYNINGATNQTITLNASGTATINNTFSVNTVINIVNVATTGTPSCVNTTPSSVILTVLPLPTASVSVLPTTICANSPATITFTGTPNSIVTYNINGATNQTITLNATGTATINNTFSANTVINIVSVATTGTPSCVNTTPSSVTITTVEPPVAGVSPSPINLCVNSPSIDLFTLLGATAQAGGTWSPPLDSGSGIFNPAVDVSNTYTYTVIGNPLCPPATVSVQVTVNPIPNAGTDGNLFICSNQNSVDLFNSLTGSPQTGGTWSPPLNSGTGIFNPAVDVSGTYTYTIVGISPCVDDTANVIVTVIPGPEAGNNGSVSLCLNSAPQDLFLLLGPNAQAGGTWSPPLNSGTGVFDPSVDAAADYTYTLTGPNPCDNDEATISVSIDPIPDAGMDGAHLFCTNDAAQDLFDFLNGTPQTGGTWSPTLASGTGVFNPLLDAAAVYTYTVGGTNCTPATAEVTVTVVQSPIAGADGQIQACADDTTIDLTSGLDGTQGAGTFADDDATGALSGTTFNPSLVLPGTYTFTYTVGGGTNPCFTDTSIVTVIVNPLPNPGTSVTIAPICASAGTLDLDTLLTGQDNGGIWTDSANQTVTSPIAISAFAEGTYSYTYTVTNSCGTDFTTVEFTILPVPTILNTNVSITPICIGLDAEVTLSGMSDGTYNLNYDLSGSNVLTNQSVQITVAGGTASFTILASDIPNSGTTIITFTSLGNTVTNCIATPSDVTGSIVINPLVTIDSVNITVANACLNTDVVVQISNATNLPDGTYQFNYSISGGVVVSGNSGDVVITSGNGQFTILASVFATIGNYTIQIDSITSSTACSNPAISTSMSFEIVAPIVAGTFNGIISVCPSTGTLDLASLLDNENAGGIWTDATNQTVTSPLNIISFAPGTYSYTYTVSNACGTDDETVQFSVLPNPQISTPNITISPACLGADVVVNLNGMTDGSYTLTYDLTGSNSATAQTVSVTITAGIGSFLIPASSLPNVGVTVISFTNIVNTVSNCTNTVVNVTSQFEVKPLADILSSNVSVAAVCFGENIIVSISNAVNLPDATYQFNYSISGAVVLSGNSGDVVITAGNGQFQLANTLFPTAGSYTLTINGIVISTTCANPTPNATTTIVINPIPSTAGANLSADATCLNFTSEVTISNATGLADGDYTIIYDLSGANTTSATVVITVVSGVATFTIPATSLVNAGDTTISILDIMSDTTLCTATGALFTPFTFSVSDLGTPTLIDKGNEFCETDNPTVADLSANIAGGQAVIWYDAVTGGTAYSETDALINGTIYYAALVSQSGCEGATRLAVTVDTTICEELIIPDGFSPNNDGINDDFHIVNLEVLYPNFKLEVYNRYGNLIYIGNKNTPRWNGTTTEKSLRLGSNVLPSGVYFFIIYFNDGTRDPYQGSVYLNR
ncbi:MAG: gliding motility-associated C-terminal domain-containing protein [Bacteroidetes bacterium]|nr:gliding motility-associated C-terminal domain-containing protein [Bacteroidota bacterium]